VKKAEGAEGEGSKEEIRSWGRCRKLGWLLFSPPREGGVIRATPRDGEEPRRKVNQFRGLFKTEGRNAVRSPELFRVGNAPWNYDDTRINGLPGWQRGYAWEPLGIFKIDRTELAVNLAASSIFISGCKAAPEGLGILNGCERGIMIRMQCFSLHSKNPRIIFESLFFAVLFRHTLSSLTSRVKDLW